MRILILILAVFLLAADFPNIPDPSGAFEDIVYISSADLSRYPGIAPCPGRCSSGYGFRRDPFNRTIRFHAGADIVNREGTVIRAVAAGTVIQAGPLPGYGYAVTVRHTSRLTTLYGHLMVVGVYVGEKITRGAPIGLLGHSGRATGNHVHYETRVDGLPVDPLEFMR